MEPSDLTDLTQYSSIPRWPFITLLFLGFFIGAAGHVFRSKTTILLGLFMIFFATVILPALVAFSL